MTEDEYNSITGLDRKMRVYDQSKNPDPIFRCVPLFD